MEAEDWAVEKVARRRRRRRRRRERAVVREEGRMVGEVCGGTSALSALLAGGCEMVALRFFERHHFMDSMEDYSTGTPKCQELLPVRDGDMQEPEELRSPHRTSPHGILVTIYDGRLSSAMSCRSGKEVVSP
jgi:hypothetical protein